MNKISVLIPCFNEEGNIAAMYAAVKEQMESFGDKYDYEIIFKDNDSKDRSQEILRQIAESDQHVKVIINARNYGISPLKNTFFGRFSGDIVILIPCDFQEPPELIPEFIQYYEEGYQVVAGQKIGSEEGPIKYGLRQIFYNIIEHLSDVPQYRNISGITLLTSEVYNLYINNNVDEPLRFFLSDLGIEIKLIQYRQQKRRSGKSSYNFWRSLSFAIFSMTSTSTVPLRLATILGMFTVFVSFLLGVLYLVLKLLFWEKFNIGTAPILISFFFIGSVQLFFIGILGEYLSAVLHKVTKNNPPIVKELLNFDQDDPLLFRSVERHEGSKPSE